MKQVPLAAGVTIALVFVAGIFSHILYQRWNRLSLEPNGPSSGLINSPAGEPQGFPVSFAPAAPDNTGQTPLPLISARDVEKIRALVGNRAKIRGRVFRVGHSAKSDTYFLNFGPSRDALTAIIFASAVPLFEQVKLPPKNFDGREVEVEGEIKNHPQYGLEIILEYPSQIRVLD